MIDIARERARTPGTAHGVHLNAAGAALRTTEVIDTVARYRAREDLIGGYEAELEAAPELERARASVSELIGATASQIALLDSSTRAWATAFGSVPLAEGDVVLVDRASYVSSALMLLRASERVGITVEVVGDDDTGQLDVEALDAALRQHGERARLVAATHVPTSNGLINPAAEVGKVTAAYGTTYLLDACQSVGQLHVDVEEIGCDFLAATGRKFLRAPRGTALLYARDPQRLDPAVLDSAGATWTGPGSWELRPDAARAEIYEYDPGARLGMGEAARQAVALGTRAIEEHLIARADQLRTMLQDLPGVTRHDRGERVGAIVTFAVEGRHARELTALLRDEHAVRLWWSQRSSAQWSLPVDSVVRASVHVYTSDDDLDRLVDVLRRV